MIEVGQLIERVAPAGLGALLSNAIFFFDAGLGQKLVAARASYMKARLDYQDEWQSCAGYVDPNELSESVVGPAFDHLSAICRQTEARVRPAIATGRLIANGLSGISRFDLPGSLWDVGTPVTVAEWLANRVTFHGGVCSSVRLRPVAEVPYEAAAFATCDLGVLASYLASRNKRGQGAHAVDHWLRQAIDAGFVSRTTGGVRFHQVIEPTASMPVKVMNWHDQPTHRAGKNGGGAPQKYNWEPVMADAMLRFQKEKNLQRHGLQTEIALFLGEQLSDENGGPANSMLADKATVILDSLRRHRNVR